MAIAPTTPPALRVEITDLTDRLDARKVIERAKGLLMTRQQITEQEAFRTMQRMAMDHRTAMRNVAYAVVERFSTGWPRPLAGRFGRRHHQAVRRRRIRGTEGVRRGCGCIADDR